MAAVIRAADADDVFVQLAELGVFLQDDWSSAAGFGSIPASGTTWTSTCD
jgi:hypothetical protein